MLKVVSDVAEALGAMFFVLDRPKSPPPPGAPRSPLPAEPPVCAQALLDLALVMRDRYWPEAGFATDADRSLASAALARIFPHYVETVERCPCEGDPARDPDDPKCSECATDADMLRLDETLARYLRDVPRPALMCASTSAAGSSFP